MFTEKLKEAQTKYGAGGSSDYFNFQDGDNRIRILAGGDIIAKHRLNDGGKFASKVCFGIHEGCPYHTGPRAIKDKNGNPAKPSIQGVFYVVDQKGDPNKILTAFLPYTILKYMDELAGNSEAGTAFTELPMPYDLIIKYNSKASDPKEYYVVTPARQNTPVSSEVLEALKNKTPTSDIKHKMETKQAREFGIELNSESQEVGGHETVIQLDDSGDENNREDNISSEEIPF